MYELNGEEVTLEFLQGKAKEYDMDFDSYLEKMKTKGLVEKTKDAAETGAPVASETTAPDVSASSSETTSSDVQESDLSLTANKHDWLVTKVTDVEDPSKLIEVPGSKKQFFNLAEEEAVIQLENKYPGFKFEQTNIYEGFGSLNAVKVTSPDGKHSKKIEFRIDLFAGKKNQQEAAYNKAYNDLTSFIDQHSTKEEDKLYIEGVKNRRKLAQDLNDRTKYSDQDKALIEEKYSTEDLFDVEETNVTTYNIQTGAPTTTVKKNQPYLEELKQAREELVKEVGAPSIKAIEERAREILVRNELSELWQSNVSNFMEELDDSGLEYYAQEYALAMKEFDREYQAKILLRNNLQAELEKGESANRLAVTQERFDNPDYQFTDVEMQPGEELVTLENGKQVPESVFNQYKKDFKEFGATLNNWKALTKDIVSNADQISETSNQLDLLKRNYNAWEEFTVETGLRFAEMGIGAAYGMSRFYGQTDDFSNKAYMDFKDKVETITESYKKDIEFDDAFTSIENFGRFAFQETINQLPVIASLLTPGGLTAIGSQSFGDQYSDMVRQDMMPGPQGETTQLAKWWSSMGYGASEVVFGSLPSLALAKNFKQSILNTATKNNLFKSGGSKYVNNNLLPAKDLATNMVLEPVGEGLTQITQNIISGRPLMDGVDHAAFSGLLFSTSMGSVPFVKGMYLRQFSDFDKKEQIRLLRAEQKDLANFNERIKKGLQLAPDQTGKRSKLIKENEARIEELQALIELEVAAVESKVKTLGNKAAEFFNANYIRQEDIRLEAQEIEQDASIPDNIKQKKLTDLKLEFDNIQNTLDKFRKSETFTNNWILFQGNKENKSEVDRINNLAKQELESEGIKDANAEQISERSRIIYNTEVINADIAKTRKARTKFSNAMEDFQTVDEAIAFLQEDAQNKKNNLDPNLSEEARAEVLAAIDESLAERVQVLKEGGHGLSMTNQYNERMAIVVVENMAKDDRLETRTHEMKHVLFAEAVGAESWRFADMADQILTWTEKNANDSYLRIISQAARYNDGRLIEDEVIAVFFEEVAGKKINLNKKTGFAGVLGHLLGKGVKDAFDIEIDLAGETDAVKFLTGVAVKIKENKLTLKDVKSVFNSEVLKKNKKLNDKIIADIFKANEENTSKFSKSVSQKDVFTNSNDALVENLKLMGIENPELFALSDAELQSLRTEDPDVFNKMIDDWNNLGDKRWMGVTIGPMWRSWVEYNHLSKRDKAFNYDLFKDEILDVATVGIEPGDNGIPFIINTWKPGQGRSLTSHIYGEIGRRLMGTDGIIDRKFPLLDKALVALDAESDVTGKSTDLTGGEDIETTLQKEKEKTKDREIAESKSFRKDLGITNEQAAEIELEIIDVLASENIKSISDFDFTKDFEKRAENKLFKVVKNMMGTRDKYVEFLNSKQATLIENIHTRDFAQMEKREENKIFLELVGENVGPERIKKALNDGSLRSFEYKSDTQGPNIYQKKKVEPKDFVDFFQVRGRKDALAKNIVHSLGMDAVFPIVNTVDARIEAAIENGDVELTKKLREVKRKYQGSVSHIKQRIDRNSDLTKFSKLYADFSVFEKKIFGSKLQDFGKAWNKHLDVDRAFEEVYGEDFLLRETETGRKSYKFRNAFLKDIKRYLSIYQQYEAIKASQGDFAEQNLESFLRDEVTSKDDVSEQDLKMIFGLEAGSIDFSNPNQLISARSALLKVMRKMGKTKSIRFIKSAVTGPTQIGGTDLIASSLTDLKPGLTQRRLDTLLAKKDKTDKDLAKIEKYKKRIAEGANPDQRYGLTDSAKDFNDNFLSELKDDNLDIPKRNTQNAKGNRSSIDQSYSNLEANAKADADFLIELMDVLAELEGNNDITANDAAMIIQTLSSGMDTPLASAAIPRYVPETKVDGPVRWEHMIPRRVVAMYLANYQRGVVSKSDIKKLFDNFFIAVIPETSDKAVTAAGFQAKMHATWGLDNIDPMPRYLNMGTFGAWDVVLYDLKNKKIVEKSKSFADANKLLLEDKFSRSSKQNMSKAISNARPVMQYSETSRGMSTFDFDETLIIDGENFIVAKKGDDVQRISSGDWPLKGPQFAAEGYEFDFTDFVNVRGGVDGPLLQKMKNQINKYGPNNVYVLTARPAESATAIHEWLKTKGVNIPFENITGLGNSSGDAKAAWMLDKYAEGYNDMYFVDDALPNVEAVQHVFNQLDVKGKSVQAKIKFSKSMSLEFNKMLERTKGIGREKTFSRIGAQKRGKNVGRFNFFVPPSADDFAGLLRYFVGRGEQGNKDLEFFNKALIKPFARADRDMKEARQAILDDHKTLRKEMPQVVKKLGKMIDDSGFTFDNAVRVYLWDKAGFEIPGLSKRDIAFLTNRIKTDQDLRTYADIIGQISKQKEGYVEPSEYWNVESIDSDLQNVVNKQGRKKFLEEWVENKNEIFSPENLNKIEAVYGSNFREALENILWRMENGTNRAKGMGRLEAAWNNWVNNSVGAIMFFNGRSSVLQTLSTVNFINFEDNNIFAAAKAFGNQKQYWKDFSFLFNSDFLKQRRAGLQTNINEAELASAVAGAANKAKAALQYLLKIGFTPTQIADSFAIAAGGATYYRNRIKKYVKEGMSQAEAESQAMLDFQEIAEETQQSARPDRISQQQASSLGRIILAFANTPMQYNRLIKKAAGDLVNGRGDWRSNVSRIVYYGAVQNIIFSSLQAAIFALAFDDEEPEQDEIDKKRLRLLNGMADSLLRGSGLAGAVVSTLKNTVMRFLAESKKDHRADYGNVLVDALNVSPPIGSKARKLYNATKTYKYNKEVMGEMNTFDLENPIWDAAGNVVSATTNVPLDIGFRKIDNLKEALNQDNQLWQRIFVGLGWDQWSLGIDSRKEVEEVKEQIKEKKKEEKKKTQRRCTKIKSDGTRCKIMVDKPKTRCHYHD